MQNLSLIFERGGIVMVPLIMLSVISVALIIDRFWFWYFGGGRTSLQKLAAYNKSLRGGETDLVKTAIRHNKTIYANVIRSLISEGNSDAIAIGAIETERPRFEKYMVALSTIITAAPLLGILGTVIGIIDSFQLLGSQTVLTEPSDVAGGIAAALLTTAVGLIVALVTLFPYMLFRAWSARSISQLETIVASSQQGVQESQK